MKLVIPRASANHRRATGNAHAALYPFQRSVLAGARRHPASVYAKRRKRKSS